MPPSIPMKCAAGCSACHPSPTRSARRTTKPMPNGTGTVQGMGLGRAYRDIRGALPDADQRKRGAARRPALQGHAAGAADHRGFQRHRQRSRAARLSRLSGRRRCHGAARLCELRHAGRLQGAPADGRQRQRQDRHRALRLGLARIEAQTGAGAWRDRLHHLFRSGRRRLCGREYLSERARASARKAYSAARCRHDALSPAIR